LTRISYVLPSRNGLGILPRTIGALDNWLTADDEILVVLNGPDDGSSQMLAQLGSERTLSNPQLVVLHSEPGLGSALAKGALGASGEYVVLSVDDLPFLQSDWLAACAISSGVGLVTGTKGHKDSQVFHRGLLRESVSLVFRIVRKVLLGTTIRDTQGTFFTSGQWLRDFANSYEEAGYMWTTALVTYAERTGVGVAEVPIQVDPNHSQHASRVNLSDYLLALKDIWKIRRAASSWQVHTEYRVANFIFPAPKRIEKLS
jgi:glycosyltransferase involved in cell wall biosynthesis